MDVSQGWKITVIFMAAAGVLSTPLIWLLDNPDAGQLAGATVQAATGIAALVWALLQTPPAAGPTDLASDTGDADGTDGGTAHTGVRRAAGAGTGAARAERTGKAVARGSGSRAGTGIDYS
ncbi:hypothetical protein [Streptomyces sp. NPDC091416]|uniref:hypothetical protein n=1 Tax=Streptomyces sp. NPDC091416 TaxID=3366003 RepID=UPI00381E3E15